MKSFMEFTKNLHENAKESNMTTTTYMQSRINILELKKGQLKALLRDARRGQNIAQETASQLRGEIAVYKETLDIATKENKKIVAKLAEVTEKCSQLQENNKELSSRLEQIEKEEEEYEEMEDLEVTTEGEDERRVACQDKH